MLRWSPLLALVIACGDNTARITPDSFIPPPKDSMPDGPPPDPLAHIQGTGLCDDPGCDTINPGIVEYTPRFPLYADGAGKRRWMQLPAGAQIDTSDMDHWVFPVGTKFWKEFAVGPTRVETRFMTKVLEDDTAGNAWTFIAYIWNATQDDTIVVPAGQQDVNGTTHDVPSRGNCRECHESLKPGRVLGFQAIQLDDNALPVDLEDLITAGTLTAPPTSGTAGARFPIPGTATDVAALGYFHANCGHCHNATSATHDTVDLELRLETGQLATVSATPAFRTAVKNPADDCGDFVDNDGDGTVDNGCPEQSLIIDNVPYPFLIVPNDPDQSGLLQRMKNTGTPRMPKIGVEVPDPDGDAAITAWINSL